ncbi:hypothetical protein [Janthinobacterium sp. 35]|uniref:hypothetical protein n=1 Tax=Janthinobacterium sp. 35 TaxID=2035210 RepID=UPI000C199E25|nr:hypothetical protein [Janthinobacterium sp. 35]
MNTWRFRLLLGLLFYSVGWAHDEIAYPWPNTHEWMLAYHGSAALCDFALMICSAKILTGRLSFDMQVLCWASIVVNFQGWIVYLTHSPPALYDVLMQGVMYAQYFRLLFTGTINGYVHSWRSFLRQSHLGRPGLHHESEKR